MSATQEFKSSIKSQWHDLELDVAGIDGANFAPQMSNQQKLTSARRIKKRREFLRLQSAKFKIRSRYFLIALEKKDLESKQESRLGITITKRVDKRAVKRNCLKRKLREFFRKNRINFKRPIDLVIIAQSGACELSSAEIEQDLKQALAKARLWKIEE